MAYHPLKRFKGKQLREELDLLIAEQLNGVVRGEWTSDQARAEFVHAIEGRFRRKKTILRHRKWFQQRLLIALLGGVPSPADDDLDLVLVYLRNRVLKHSLSLAEARERMQRAVRLLDPDTRSRWVGALEADLMGDALPAAAPEPAPRRRWART